MLWGTPSVLWRIFITVGGYDQYYEGATSVLWMVFRTVRDIIGTVEGYQEYC